MSQYVIIDAHLHLWEKQNGRVNQKPVVGVGGGRSDFGGEIRQMMDTYDVAFQTAELGKVDVGGGGTIAYIMSLYGMQVIDSGVAVLNMHAPWEITSKSDIYETKKGYVAFLKQA